MSLYRARGKSSGMVAGPGAPGAAQAAIGRSVRQGPVNYAGRGGMVRGPGRVGPGLPGQPQPAPAPAQVADRSFRRTGAQPVRDYNAPAPQPPPMAGQPPPGRRPGDVSTGLPAGIAGRLPQFGYGGSPTGMAGQPPPGQRPGDVAATGGGWRPGMPQGNMMGGALQPDLRQALGGRFPTKQLASGPSVLGGGAAPMGVYDPNAGRQEAQPIGMQTSMLSDAASNAFTALSPFGSRTANTPTEDSGQQTDAQQEQGQQGYVGPTRTNSRVEQAMHNAYDGGQFLPGTDANNAGLPPFPGPPGSDSGNPFGGPGDMIADILGGLTKGIGETFLNPISSSMTENDIALLDKYQGDSTNAYKDMLDASRGIMSPEARKAAEDAARKDLYAGVSSNKDADLRRLYAQAGRGGRMSAGAETGINQAAADALASGERGLAQDAFGRQLAATQTGLSGLGQGGRLLQDLRDAGITTNKEVAAMLLGGADRATDLLKALDDMAKGPFYGAIG